MTQFLSDHGNFAAKLHSMALVESPLCSACGHESNDVSHALWSFPVLDRDVEMLVERLNESGIQDLSFDELVADRTAFFFLRDHVGGVCCRSAK